MRGGAEHGPPHTRARSREPAAAPLRAGDRPRFEVQRDIKAKERAREAIAKKYCSSQLSRDDILTAIYSLSDNNSFLLFNRHVCCVRAL